MKNIFKTKAVPVAALSLACIGILAVSLLIGKEEKTDFQPEAPIPEASTLEWTETPPETGMQPDTARPAGNSGNNTGTYAASQSPSSDDGSEAYPKVVDETEQHVTIDFTPEAEKLQPEPPAAPVAEGGTDDPEQPPVYAPEDLEPEPTTAPAQPDTPTAGATNGNGAVYDPVFGWVVPGNVSQTPMDSAGDPDKMVGNM